MKFVLSRQKSFFETLLLPVSLRKESGVPFKPFVVIISVEKEGNYILRSNANRFRDIVTSVN